MSEDQKKRRILASIAAAGLMTGVAPAVASPPPQIKAKAEIVHKGRTIEVSCNALQGHARHADAEEDTSLLRAQERCVKIEARNSD